MTSLSISILWLCGVLMVPTVLSRHLKEPIQLQSAIATFVVVFGAALWMSLGPDQVAVLMVLILAAAIRFKRVEVVAAATILGLGAGLYAASGVVWWVSILLSTLCALASVMTFDKAGFSLVQRRVLATGLIAVTLMSGTLPAMIAGWQTGLIQKHLPSAETVQPNLPVWVLAIVTTGLAVGIFKGLRGSR